MAHAHPVTRRLQAFGIAGCLSLAASSVLASNFALIEQSVSSMGTAYAGAGSIAQDASTVFFNPASMSRLEGRQLSTGLHIVLPETEFTGGANYNPLYGGGAVPVVPGSPIATGPDNDTDGGEVGVVPHFTYVQELDDKWDFGFTVNAPFGLKTEYGTGWVGRYSAIESEILTLNLNPNVSYQVDDHVTLAFGVSAMYANIKLFNAIDDVFLGAGATDSFGQIDIDDWGFGWNFGALLEPTDHTRLGFSYRSKIEVELDGTLITNSLALPSTSADADVSIPDSLLLSAYHEVDDQWAVMADIMWTQWSKIDALVARLGNGTSNTIALKYEDSARYAVGASYKHNAMWTFRGGVAFDETPVTSPEFRIAGLPDEDRTWVTVGAGYNYSKDLSFDFGYAHLFIDDTRINSTDSFNSAVPLTEGLHRLDGEYESSVDIISAQANWKF